MWAHLRSQVLSFFVFFRYNKAETEVNVMPESEARLKASKKYHQEKLEEIKFRVPKGNKARIQEHAKAQGESTNAFIYRAINETIARDKEK